jgi:hypothetical protein
VRDGGEQDDLIGSLLGGPTADLGDDPDIGIDRQVGAVVLKRADGNQTHPILGGGSPDLRPRQAFVQERPGPHELSISSLDDPSIARHGPQATNGRSAGDRRRAGRSF